MHLETSGVPTSAVPQANKLTSLRAVVAAVAEGLTATAEIGRRARLSVRHARYYLVATQTLGWVNFEGARPRLTRSGQDLIQVRERSLKESDLIAAAICGSAVLRATVGEFLAEDLDQESLVERLMATTGLSHATASRRAACLVAWRTQLIARGWGPARMAKERTPEPVLVSFLELSVRAQGVLDRLGVSTPQGLAEVSRQALEKARNCGRKTRLEILAWARANHVLFKGEVNRSVASVARRESIDSIEAMPVELLLRVSELNLSVRAAGCLEKLGVNRIGDLVLLTQADLLNAKNCGRRTVKELEALLTSFGLSLAMEVPIWRTVNVALLARRRAAALTRIRRRRFKKLYVVDSSRGLEAEVTSALRAVLKASDVPKVELWIGLDHDAPPTLQEVGEAADVTRERIRQIVEKAKSKIAVAEMSMPRLSAAVDLLEGRFVLSESRAQYLLRTEGLSERKVSTRGVLRAAEFFSVPTRVEHARIAGTAFLGSPAALAALKTILRVGRRAVEQWGCSTIDDVCAQIVDQANATVDADSVRDAIAGQPGFRWLDEKAGWFWLEGVPRNRVLNKIDKILAVTPQVDLSALRAGIARNYRMEGFAPPSGVLRALCEQLKDCDVVGGRIIVDRRPRDPAIELSAQERAMVEVFRAHGPALSYADAVRRCIEAGLNETTTTIYLANSPVLRRVALGVYTLVGATVTPGEIESVAKTVVRGRKSQIVQDYGWRPDGSGVWATYRISAGMLRSGVVGVPAGIKKYLDPQGYELRGGDDSSIGRIGVSEGSMWGFLPFFRRRGGEPDDYLRVTFNLSEHVARVEVAEEPFDDSSDATDETRIASMA